MYMHLSRCTIFYYYHLFIFLPANFGRTTVSRQAIELLVFVITLRYARVPGAAPPSARVCVFLIARANFVSVVAG